MKRLMLLRHGKSEWGNADMDDFDRPLAPRGIKASKKIDVVEDGFGGLPARKKLTKAILALTTGAPFVLGVPRALIAIFGSWFAMRHLLFPMYRWVGHYHYAVGMRRGLDEGR